MKKNKFTQKGFTLIELILYVALLSLFISSAIFFTWDIIYGSAKSAIQREINQNMRLANKRITYEIRNADSILSLSTSEICLSSATASNNPTKIYSTNGRLYVGWGGGSNNCTNLTHSYPITSNSVNVSNISFSNRSSGTSSYNISFSFTISSSGARQEWQMSHSSSSSAEIRSN